jgi:hypothetical protein
MNYRPKGKYKGRGKHSVEELEDYINQLLDEKSEQELLNNKEPMYNELSQLVKEIYKSCKDFIEKPDETIQEPISIVRFVKIHLEEFSKNYKFNLL